jgi:choline dehydrogenase-like flavoprotein
MLRHGGRVFSERERTCLLAIAETAIPPGRLQGGAGRPAVERLEQYVAGLGATGVRSFRGVVNAIDASAYANHLRPFPRLAPAKRLALLERWRKGSYLRRSALRLLLTPLKIAHFDNAPFFRSLGCAWGVDTPAHAPAPPWMRERAARAAELGRDEDIEADVVVVGTGAGGAVVGKELAEKGYSVVLLEEGEYFDRRHFNGHFADATRFYREPAETLTLGNVGIPVPVGRTVGGSTTVNAGTCYRVPPRVLRRWRDELGLTEFSVAAMDAYYQRVEAILRVARAEPRQVGKVGEVIARGCDALGYKHLPLRRNAPECDGKGVCVFGCPTEAKRSTNVSYVPLALKAGAHLFSGARVERIVTDGGRAVGVVARAVGGAARLTVRARATIIACGTFYTPVLLDGSGLGRGSGQLGKNLSIHPATATMAWFDETIQGYNSIPQGYAIEEFHDEGLLFEGSTAPIDFGAGTLPLVGPRFTDLVERFDRLAMFGFMIEDTSRGRVWNRNGKPLITYVMNDADVAKMKRGQEILARVFFAAGARTVMPLVHGFDELRGEADLARFRRAHLRARDLDVTAYHPLGTARMGVDPRTSVVGPDHAVHDCPDLYVVDGSAVPSSLAVNPQVTIMALATRAADRIADRLG